MSRPAVRQKPIHRGRTPTPGGVVYAASAAQADVADAIAAANPGDTVYIPEGEETWTSAVVLNKVGLRVQGAGIGLTNITTNLISAFTVSANNVFLSHLSLLGCESAVAVTSSQGWRVHHIAFVSTTYRTAVLVRNNGSKTVFSHGLVDNCTFTNMRVLSQQFASTTASDLNGHTLWSQPCVLGDEAAVYVEDCTFNFNVFGNCVDANHSGRYVFRHNAVHGTYIEAHSIQSGYSRATRRWEIYDNTIDQVGYTPYWIFTIRGGTGVIFNNTVTGTYGASWIGFNNVRSEQDVGPEAGICDGTSIWDGNEEANGYWARDQIGSGADAGTWTTAPYPAQARDPAYVWENYLNGSLMTCTVYNAPSQVHIHKGRDYYENVGPKPGYTSYTYPHPLRAGD